MTKRETILEALDARLLAALAPLGVEYGRNRALPSRVPDEGLAILRDGDPGEPEPLMSPLRYVYEHRAELEVYVQAGTGRETAMDAILAAVGAAISTEPTLGGLCDWVEPQAPAPSDVPFEAGVPFRSATVPVLLIYETATPLA